ncbi:MAG: hydrolase [bacterium]|nr:hydrolase [bacterium]
MMIRRDGIVLLVIDFQDRLLPKIPVASAIIPQVKRMVRFCRELKIPILWTEQYPKGLGGTVNDVACELKGMDPIEKTAFGCMGDAGFVDALKATARKQLLITGVEAHVCVMQTALEAIEQGYEVFIVRDAVGSRAKREFKAGVARMRDAGAELVTAEMAMFEILRQAGTPEFKRVLPLLK